MNIGITNGLTLSPPAFHAGLRVWSQGNGRAGDETWFEKPNARIIPADQDFGQCLEIQKQQDTTRLRFTGETPIIPGVYLRVSARVKLVAGPSCEVRIAGWAGDGKRKHVGGLTEVGKKTLLPDSGHVVEISTIVGVGSRDGVDMGWGIRPVFGHFGLDLIGDSGGTVRIQSIEIEDITTAFIPSLIDWVDVRDYGAKGDGTSNDHDAFIAADQAANGGEILVPEGTYFISGDIGINAKIRFKGKLKTPDSTRVVFLKNFDYPTYVDAFGDETLAFKKALQALIGYSDHASLDLCGRRVDIKEPLILNEIRPKSKGFSNRRTIRNGSILAVSENGGDVWKSKAIKSDARYDPSAAKILSNVTNVAAIEIGSLVTGAGVGREVYVNGRDIGKGTLSLSQPLYGAEKKQIYTFTRFRYIFDFSGFNQLDRLGFKDLDINCEGIASFLMLPVKGERFSISDCNILKPADRGITSIGRACQDLVVDQCQFDSNESPLPASQRHSIALNINANDSKIRNNRFARFMHFMVAAGTGHLISGNHWFQGDGSTEGLRFAGLVLTTLNVQTNVVGNYVDNASIEWTNEHYSNPKRTGNQSTFRELTITGNTFLASHISDRFSWLVIKPYGTGHTVDGMNVSGNVFKAYFGEVDRIDRVDSSIATLDLNEFRNVHFEGNTFSGVKTFVSNPIRLTHQQSTKSNKWLLSAVSGFPFNAAPRSVESVIAETAITESAGKQRNEMPWVQIDGGKIRLNWNTPLSGKVAIYARADRQG